MFSSHIVWLTIALYYKWMNRLLVVSLRMAFVVSEFTMGNWYVFLQYEVMVDCIV